MFNIICLFITISTSFATNVAVYDDFPYHTTKVQLPLKYSCHKGDRFYARIFWINKSPSVTGITVTFKLDKISHKAEKHILDHGPRQGEEFYFVESQCHSAKLKIKLNLYVSNILCSSLSVAEGMKVTKTTNKKLTNEFKYYGPDVGYEIYVNLKNVCDGPPLATGIKMNVTTVKTFTDVKVNNKTLTKNNVPNTSPHCANIETTRKIASNATRKYKDADKRNYSTIIIIVLISSISGTLLIQLVIFAIWKRWIKRNPLGAPQIPTIQPNPDPFYLNTLFRRECDEEIAEINEHLYQEIVPRDTEDSRK